MIVHAPRFEKEHYRPDNGEQAYKIYKIEGSGACQLHFRIIETNSPHRQGITLFSSDFKGKLKLNGKRIRVPKGPFQHYVFKEEEFPNNEFVLHVHVESGGIYFDNASERNSGGGFVSGYLGCAFWVEELEENHLRFHCNDHDVDHDFNDMIFDLIIQELKD